MNNLINKFLLGGLVLNFCFAGFKIGAITDFKNSPFIIVMNDYSYRLETTYLVGYEATLRDYDHMSIGVEYILPSEIEDTNIDLSIVSIYSLYSVSSENSGTMGGFKVGYFIPYLDDRHTTLDYTSKGGMMWAVQITFNYNIHIGYTAYHGTYKFDSSYEYDGNTYTDSSELYPLRAHNFTVSYTLF